MGYKDIFPGEKTALPIAARFVKSSKGTVGIEVAFEFMEGGNKERLNWVGWLSGKAIDNTMKTLVDVLGFNGDDSVDENSRLKNPNALNYQQEVILVVEMETNPDDGKSYPRIKWVNSLSGSAFKGLVPETIRGELDAVGFKAAFLAAKKSSPAAQQKVSPPVQQPVQGGMENKSGDGLPF